MFTRGSKRRLDGVDVPPPLPAKYADYVTVDEEDEKPPPVPRKRAIPVPEASPVTAAVPQIHLNCAAPILRLPRVPSPCIVQNSLFSFVNFCSDGVYIEKAVPLSAKREAVSGQISTIQNGSLSWQPRVIYLATTILGYSLQTIQGVSDAAHLYLLCSPVSNRPLTILLAVEDASGPLSVSHLGLLLSQASKCNLLWMMVSDGVVISLYRRPDSDSNSLDVADCLRCDIDKISSSSGDVSLLLQIFGNISLDVCAGSDQRSPLELFYQQNRSARTQRMERWLSSVQTAAEPLFVAMHSTNAEATTITLHRSVSRLTVVVIHALMAEALSCDLEPSKSVTQPLTTIVHRLACTFDATIADSAWKQLAVFLTILDVAHFNGEMDGCATGLLRTVATPDCHGEASDIPAKTDAPESTDASLVRRCRQLFVQWLRYLQSCPVSQGRCLDFAHLAPLDLGRAYEILVSTVFTDEPVSSRKHADDRLARNIYYTPAWPVDVIVRGTLRPLITQAFSKHAPDTSPLKSISELRILDPAAGCGNIVLRAARYLASETLNCIAGSIHACDTTLTIQYLVNEVVTHAIYGIDTDPTAVFVTRASLSLFAMQFHSKPSKHVPGFPYSILPELSTHIRHGDSLTGCVSLADLETHPQFRTFVGSAKFTSAVGTLSSSSQCLLTAHQLLCDLRVGVGCIQGNSIPSDILVLILNQLATCQTTCKCGAHCHEAWRSIRAAAANNLPRQFHWFLSFPAVMNSASGGFDAVITNPPWSIVEHVLPSKPTSEDMDRKVECQVLSDVLRSPLYPFSGMGKKQLYNAFIERSVALLRTGGRLGCVTQNALLSADNSLMVRQLLSTHTNVDFIFEFAAKNIVFPDVHKGVAIVVCQKQARSRPSFVKLFVPSVMHRDTGQSERNRSLTGTNTHWYQMARRGLIPVSNSGWLSEAQGYMVPTALSGLSSLDSLALGTSHTTLLDKLMISKQGDFNSSVRKDCRVTECSESDAVPYVEGKHVRAFSLVHRDTLSPSHDHFTTYVPPSLPKQHRVVMQEVVDLNKARKCVAAVLAPSVLCAHSTTVHEINWTYVKTIPALASLRLNADLVSKSPLVGAIEPAVLFVVGLLNSKLLEWILRTRERNDHVSKSALMALPVPIWTTASSSVVQADGVATAAVPTVSITASRAAWHRCERMSQAELCQLCVDETLEAMLASKPSVVIDAAVCRLYGVSFDGFTYLEGYFNGMQHSDAINQSQIVDTVWPTSADLDSWCTTPPM